MKKIIRVSEENIKYIIDQYQNKISSEKIAKELNLHPTTICKILKRKNIKIKSPEESHRKYNINENYFQKIDNENKAYFLGFLYADETLQSTRYIIRLMLNYQDVSILEKFSNEIFNKILTKYYNKYPSITIYSKLIYNDLIKLGCTPNKAFTITFPTTNIVPDNLMNHFIRGFFDGDGCITLKSGYPRIDITSNEQFLTGMISYIESKTDLKFNKLYISGNEDKSRSFQTKKKVTVQGLIKYMYKDATIYLNRKYEKCMEALNNYESYLDKNKIL